MLLIITRWSCFSFIHLTLQTLNNGLNLCNLDIQIMNFSLNYPLKTLLVLYEVGQTLLDPLSNLNEIKHLVGLGFEHWS